MGEYYVTGSFKDLALYFYNENGDIAESFNKTELDRDIYIAKYNSNGTLSWARRIEGTGNDQPFSIVTDNTNIYVTGNFTSSVLNFYNENGNIDLSINRIENNNDIFIAKYLSNGTISWVRRIGGGGTNIPDRILTDNTNIYLVGRCDLQLNYYNENGVIDLSLNPSETYSDIFIAKYNLNGNILWARRIGGTGNNKPFNNIIIDNTNIYLTGRFNSPLKFYNENGDISLVFNYDGDPECFDTFIAKYLSNGTLSWTRRIGGTLTELTFGIVTDNTNVYITGVFGGPTINFYNENGVIELSFNADQPNVSNTFYAFIAKYLSNGTLSWARNIGGMGYCDSLSIVTNNTDIYITGEYTSSLNFYNENGGIDLSLNAIGSASDIYIAKYLSNGNISWARTIGGIINETPVSIVTENTNLYIVGRYRSSPLNFYDQNGDIVMSLNIDGERFDTFIAKYQLDGTFSWARRIGGVLDDLPSSIIINNTNVYVTGIHRSPSLNFYNENGVIDISFNKIETANDDTYIAKYLSNGTLEWATRIEETSRNFYPSVCITTIQYPTSNICFLKGTPVVTDQGIIEIQNITNENTINNIKVQTITQTTTEQEYLICIEKDAFGENVPSERTVITRNHKILHNGELVAAGTLFNTTCIPYNGEILYNVLLQENGVMNVNNLICETLDVNNVIAYLYRYNKINDQRVKELNNTKDKDVYKRKILEILNN